MGGLGEAARVAMLLKPVVGFVLKVLILFAALVAPWPPLESACARASAGACELVLDSIDFGADVSCERLSAGGACDMTIRFRDPATGRANASSVYSGYVWRAPLAFFVALVLASAVPWRAAARAVVLGAQIVIAYVVAKLVVLSALAAGSEPVRTLDVAPGTIEWLRRAHGVLWQQPLLWYVPAVVAWGLVLGPLLGARLQVPPARAARSRAATAQKRYPTPTRNS